MRYIIEWEHTYKDSEFKSMERFAREIIVLMDQGYEVKHTIISERYETITVVVS